MASKRKREIDDDLSATRQPSALGDDFEHQYLNTDDTAIESSEHVIDFDALGNHSDHHHHENRSQPEHAHNNGASEAAAAAMAQYHTMTVPHTTEQAFLEQSAHPSERHPDDVNDVDLHPDDGRRESSFGEFVESTSHDTQHRDDQTQEKSNISNDDDYAGVPPPEVPGTNDDHPAKPVIGSEEWHKYRRDNHKEVERRRRETINEGITQLSKIVPGCEKNKGQILRQAVEFINGLKENETANIEKWTLEKLLTDQAIAELSASCDKLKDECHRAWAEAEGWKQAALKAGVTQPEPAELREMKVHDDGTAVDGLPHAAAC